MKKIMLSVALSLMLVSAADAKGFAWFFANIKPTGSCGFGREVAASWYNTGRITANGERFNPNGISAAHKTLPFGTMVTITNPKNGRSVTVRINDRGPFVKGVTIDLSRGAARAIGMHSTQWVCMS